MHDGCCRECVPVWCLSQRLSHGKPRTAAGPPARRPGCAGSPTRRPRPAALPQPCLPRPPGCAQRRRAPPPACHLPQPVLQPVQIPLSAIEGNILPPEPKTSRHACVSNYVVPITASREVPALLQEWLDCWPGPAAAQPEQVAAPGQLACVLPAAAWLRPHAPEFVHIHNISARGQCRAACFHNSWLGCRPASLHPWGSL
jgi:hypothetical protein